MSWLALLKMGMPVYAADGLLGSVVSVPPPSADERSADVAVLVLANRQHAGPGVDEFRRVTLDQVDRIENGALVLIVPASEVPTSSVDGAVDQHIQRDAHAFRVPIHEEAVDVRRRVVQLGDIRVQKLVDELIDEREVGVRHHELLVERVPHDRVVPELIEPFMDGDTYVVPVIEEEIVIQRRLRLKEEIRIRRVVAQTSETVRTPYRRERVLVEEHWRDRRGSSPNGDGRAPRDD